MSCRKQTLAGNPQHSLALGDVLAREVVKLGGAHVTLKLRTLNHLSIELVGRKQHVVFKEDVIDSDYALFAQNYVARLRVAAMHLQPDAEVSIVIDVRA